MRNDLGSDADVAQEITTSDISLDNDQIIIPDGIAFNDEGKKYLHVYK